MAMSNQLAQQQAAKNNKLTTIKTDTGEIQLSSNIVRNYLVAGNGDVTDQEVKLFIALCSAHKLNPFIKEAHLIKYGSSSPATMVVSKDVYQKRANKNPDYKGKKAGIIVLNQNGEITYREGMFYIKAVEQLVGGWCEVYKVGDTIPERVEVAFDEYVGLKKDGTPNSQWATKPATMIRKVAVAQALREAFTEDYQGLYIPEEFGQDSESLDNAPVEQPIINTSNVVADVKEQPSTEDILAQMDAEMGIVDDDPMA